MINPIQWSSRVKLVTVLMLCTAASRMAHVFAAQQTPSSAFIIAGQDRDEDLWKWQKIDESLDELQERAEESLHPVAGGLWALGLNEEWWEKLALTSEQRTLVRAAFTQQMAENTARRQQRQEAKNLPAGEMKSVEEKLQQLREQSHARGAKELEELLTAEQRTTLENLLRSNPDGSLVFANEISKHAGITNEQLRKLAKIWMFYTSQMDGLNALRLSSEDGSPPNAQRFSNMMTELNRIRGREFWSVLTDEQAALLAKKGIRKPKFVASPEWLSLIELVADNEEVILLLRDSDSRDQADTKPFSCNCVMLRALVDKQKQAELARLAADASGDPRSVLELVSIETERRQRNTLPSAGWTNWTPLSLDSIGEYLVRTPRFAEESLPEEAIDLTVTCPLPLRKDGDWLKISGHPARKHGDGRVVARVPDFSVLSEMEYEYRMRVQWVLREPEESSEFRATKPIVSWTPWQTLKQPITIRATKKL